jgi:hypothetical protein
MYRTNQANRFNWWDQKRITRTYRDMSSSKELKVTVCKKFKLKDVIEALRALFAKKETDEFFCKVATQFEHNKLLDNI